MYAEQYTVLRINCTAHVHYRQNLRKIYMKKNVSISNSKTGVISSSDLLRAFTWVLQFN